MTTLIIVICIIAFLVWLGRLLRQRELKKFRDVDVDMLSELRQQHPGEPSDGIPSIPSLASDLPEASVPLQRQRFVDVANPSPAESVEAAGLSDLIKPTLKDRVFDERTRQTLQLLESQLEPGYRILVAVPLSEFVMTSNCEPVSYLIVDQNLVPSLAVEFFDQGFTEPMKILKDLKFPFMRLEGNESAPSIRLKLKSMNTRLVTQAGNSPSCPRCSSKMNLREPKAGKNAGRRYWLCQTYPKCRGVVEL